MSFVEKGILLPCMPIVYIVEVTNKLKLELGKGFSESEKWHNVCSWSFLCVFGGLGEHVMTCVSSALTVHGVSNDHAGLTAELK